MIQILGGLLKGYKVKVIENRLLKPTSVLLRRKIFDRYQDLNSAIFFDLFAGTGAMGIEALSRGASQAIFFENDKAIFSCLEKNIYGVKQRCQQLNLSSKLNLHLIDCLEPFAYSLILKYIAHTNNCPIIFYLDPPYQDHEKYRKIIEIIYKIKQPVFLWIEHEGISEMIHSLCKDKFQLEKQLQQKNKMISIYSN